MRIITGGLAGLLLAAISAGAAAPVREWDARKDGAPADGKQVLSVRLAPTATKEYEMLVFEIPLRQSYERTDSLGKTTRRTTEPAVFVYREKNVRLVQDLDKHISFWVPVALNLVREAFGETLFVDAPVLIQTVRITAMVNGVKEWTIEAPLDGSVCRPKPDKSAPGARAPAPRPPAPPAGGARP